MGKIEPEVSGFKSLLWGEAGVAKSLTAVNTCLDEMEEFKGRDTALLSNEKPLWLKLQNILPLQQHSTWLAN